MGVEKSNPPNSVLWLRNLDGHETGQGDASYNRFLASLPQGICIQWSRIWHSNVVVVVFFNKILLVSSTSQG